MIHNGISNKAPYYLHARQSDLLLFGICYEWVIKNDLGVETERWLLPPHSIIDYGKEHFYVQTDRQTLLLKKEERPTGIGMEKQSNDRLLKSLWSSHA